MSESVQVALISLFGALWATTLPLLWSTRKHAKTSAEQTKNSHPQNLRDDIDLVLVAVDSMQRHHGITDTLVRNRAEKVRTRNRSSL